MDFDQANAKVHHVADQWHYDTMVKAQFSPQNLEATGFVRSYTYHKGEHIIVVSTGASCDYWQDKTPGLEAYKGGYWAELAPYVATLR